MSKKKNKKFKKRHSIQPAAAEHRIETVQLGVTQSVTNEPIMANGTEIVEKKSEIDTLNEKYQYVRRDVNKLLIILATLAILFVGIYFLGQKTSVLNNLGDWVHKVLNLQL